MSVGKTFLIAVGGRLCWPGFSIVSTGYLCGWSTAFDARAIWKGGGGDPNQRGASNERKKPNRLYGGGQINKYIL